MKMKDYLIGFLVVALFIIAFISFGIEMGDEHSASVNLNNDSRINTLYSGVNATVYNYDGGSIQSEGNSTLEGFNAEDPSGAGSDGIFFSTVTAVGKSIMGVAFAIFDAIWDPILKIIMPNSPEIRRVISVVLSTILLFLVTLLAWRLYRIGE
jgi:hypothetical protein